MCGLIRSLYVEVCDISATSVYMSMSGCIMKHPLHMLRVTQVPAGWQEFYHADFISDKHPIPILPTLSSTTHRNILMCKGQGNHCFPHPIPAAACSQVPPYSCQGPGPGRRCCSNLGPRPPAGTLEWAPFCPTSSRDHPLSQGDYSPTLNARRHPVTVALRPPHRTLTTFLTPTPVVSGPGRPFPSPLISFRKFFLLNK